MISSQATRSDAQVGLATRRPSPLAVFAVLSGQALRGLRGTPFRTTVSSVVAMVAVLLLLAGLSISGVAQARTDRAAQRSPTGGVADLTGNDVLYLKQDSYYQGQHISAQAVATRGHPTELPAGLGHLPAPGELAVSPALRALMADPSTTLAQRYPGRITQLVGPAGLIGPHELLIWIGRTPADIGPDAVPVRAFGQSGGNAFSLPPELRAAQTLMVVGFLVPIVALLVTCSTIGSAQRDRRLSALRLLGLTAWQSRFVTASESGVIAVVSVLGGNLLFWLLRAPLGPLIPVDGGVFPMDIGASAWTILALLALIPALAIGASIIALRLVSVSPLAVVRRVATPQPSLWRLAPLLVGGAILLLELALAPRLHTRGRLGGLLVAAGVLVAVGGLVVGSATINHRLARFLQQRIDLGLAASIGLRQIQRASARSSRTVTGLSCLVFVSGLLFSFFPLLADAAAGDQRALAERAGESTLFANVPADAAVNMADIRDTPGVTGVTAIRQVAVQTDMAGVVSTLLVVNCADLSRALSVANERCTRGLRLGGSGALPLEPGAQLQATLQGQAADGSVQNFEVGSPFGLPGELARADVLAELSEANGMAAEFALPEHAVARDLADQLQRFPGIVVVRHDGHHLEEVRTAVVLATRGAPALTAGEILADKEKTTRTFRGLTWASVASAALVGFLSLLVAMVDQLREQLRVLSTLWVMGTPMRTLRTAMLVQAGAVAIPAIVLSYGLSVLAAAAFVRLATVSPQLPLAEITYVTLAAVAAPLLAALAIMPMLKRAGLGSLPTE